MEGMLFSARQAITQALGDKAGITRYGHTICPMEEALATVALD
ncbi:imidazoleglycerol-phosphate dehydratase, partial [bacterium CPR1]|nr:imidazoleglycerol-phosphate dehydratase [bacterium CPR1]